MANKISLGKNGKGWLRWCPLLALQTNITPRLSNVKKHEQTAKHKRQAHFQSRNTKIYLAPTKEDERVKSWNVNFAVNITCHSSIMVVDHLSEIMVQHGKGSKLAKIKLHRTKCSLLVKKVIAPALYQDLCADMAGQKYCVILDESTDFSCTKLLCVSVRYNSKSEKRIMTSFLSLLPMVKATGKDLFEALKSCLEQSGLDLVNYIGYASDGASVMVGEHDSVSSRIKATSPNCVMIKCLCHSLSLCIKHAFETMPENLGFMLSEIPKWFSKSVVRRDAYKQLFTAFKGCDVESSSSLPKMQSNKMVGAWESYL